MSGDFSLFEVTSYNDVEIHKEHTVEELFYIKDMGALILSNWFYRLHGDYLDNNIMEHSYYVEIIGSDLIDLIECLEYVLNEDDEHIKNIKAMHYFPVTYMFPNHIDDVGMWSDKYYEALAYVHKLLKQILPSNSVTNRERLFLYNIL